MSLFQKPPKSAAEASQYKPLDIPPDEVLEFDEARWYRKVYRGDVPQLTVRVVLVGSILGFLLAFTNPYIGLKTGWTLGVAITACIVSYALWGGLQKLGIARTNMTILETNCMQSTASSAGYSTGGTMVSAIAALLMLSATPENPERALRRNIFRSRTPRSSASMIRLLIIHLNPARGRRRRSHSRLIPPRTRSVSACFLHSKMRPTPLSSRHFERPCARQFSLQTGQVPQLRTQNTNEGP